MRDLRGNSPRWVLWATIAFWVVFLAIVLMLVVFLYYLGPYGP